MAQYLPLLVMLILAGLFAGLSFLASSLLGQRRRPTAAKVAPCCEINLRRPKEWFGALLLYQGYSKCVR